MRIVRPHHGTRPAPGRDNVPAACHPAAGFPPLRAAILQPFALFRLAVPGCTPAAAGSGPGGGGAGDGLCCLAAAAGYCRLAGLAADAVGGGRGVLRGQPANGRCPAGSDRHGRHEQPAATALRATGAGPGCPVADGARPVVSTTVHRRDDAFHRRRAEGKRCSGHSSCGHRMFRAATSDAASRPRPARGTACCPGRAGRRSAVDLAGADDPGAVFCADPALSYRPARRLLAGQQQIGA